MLDLTTGWLVYLSYRRARRATGTSADERLRAELTRHGVPPQESDPLVDQLARSFADGRGPLAATVRSVRHWA